MSDSKGTILVVDDDQAVRNVVSRKIQLMGYECVSAADGREALEKTAAQSFDLVLLDMKMPGPSGMEVLSRLSAEHPHTGVVMVTAIVDVETAVEAMKEGADDYVTKPFNLDDLALRVEKAIERRRLIRENQGFHLRDEKASPQEDRTPL